jgi:hypothetical protein
MQSDDPIVHWLSELAAKIDAPLQSKIFRKKTSEFQIGVQLYSARSSCHFYVEFKIYHSGISSFGKPTKDNFPILDRRLYSTHPIPGEKAPADFVIGRENGDRLASLRENLISQGTELFSSIRSLEDLRAYYKGELPGVFIEESERSAGQAFWIPKIEGYLSDRSNGVTRA